MPLIKSQQVVSVVARGGGEDEAIVQLHKALAPLPDCKIVSVATRSVSNPLGRGEWGLRLTAVIEFV